MKKIIGYAFIALMCLIVVSCAVEMSGKPSGMEQWRASQKAEAQILQNNLMQVKP